MTGGFQLCRVPWAVFNLSTGFRFSSPLPLLPEPVGSVQPKISVGERRKDAEVPKHGDLSIFCPAQSYPVPAFR